MTSDFASGHLAVAGGRRLISVIVIIFLRLSLAVADFCFYCSVTRCALHLSMSPLDLYLTLSTYVELMGFFPLGSSVMSQLWVAFRASNSFSMASCQEGCNTDSS